MTSLAGESIHVRVATTYAEVASLKADWTALWHANPHPEIFNAFPWLDAWWSSFGDGLELRVAVVSRSTFVIGILPLVRDGDRLRFFGAPAADYNDVLCADVDAPTVLDVALAALLGEGRTTSCDLENVREDSRIARYFQVRTSVRGRRARIHCVEPCLTIVLGDAAGLVLREIIAKRASRSAERRLTRRGALVFRHLDERGEILAHLDEFVRQHVRRKAMAGIRSQLATPEGLRFYRALAEGLDPAGELRFSVLELDGKPLAYDWGFEYAGKHLSYTLAFDVDAYEASPGLVLFRRLLIDAGERNIREFDFGSGDEAYKRRFANRLRKNYHIRLYGANARGYATCGIDRSIEAARRHVRVYRTLRRVRATAPRLRAVIGREGFAGASRRIIRYLAAFIYERVEVTVFSLDREVPLPVIPFVEQLALRRAKLSDLIDIAAADPELVVPDHGLYRQRLRNGDRAYVAEAGGHAVHVVWTRVTDEVVASEVGEDRRVRLRGPHSIIYDARTAPKARGRGIYPAVLQMLVREARDVDRPSVVYCLRENSRSQRGIEKAGFVEFARLRRVLVLRR